MNTRKLCRVLHRVLCHTYLVYLSTPLYGKQNPGFISPAHVSAMQQERENDPIDKLELAKAQEQFKPRPVKYTKRGTQKKQRKAHKTLRYMTYEETKAGKEKLIANENYIIALKYQERMIKLCDDLDELEFIMLEYADTHHTCKHYDKATALYTEFVKSFPGSTHTEYALYQAIECSFHLILDAERDQTNTKKTVELTNEFLAKQHASTQYTEAILDIRDRCYKLLANSECNIYKFYLHNGEYAQAERRLKDLRTDWLAKIPDFEPELLVLEYDLAKKQNNIELATVKQHELDHKYPQASILLTKQENSYNFLHKF